MSFSRNGVYVPRFRIAVVVAWQPRLRHKINMCTPPAIEGVMQAPRIIVVRM